MTEATAVVPTDRVMHIMLGTSQKLSESLAALKSRAEAGDEKIDFAPGDVKFMWDSLVPREVEQAKEQFKKLQKEGFQLYKADKNGAQGEFLREFDPAAERVIATLRSAGG